MESNQPIASATPTELPPWLVATHKRYIFVACLAYVRLVVDASWDFIRFLIITAKGTTKIALI